jgi:ribosomal protein S18 acetylase RimI-like enzyme
MASYLESAFSPHKQADELTDPLNTFLLAEAGETVVGYARLHLGSPLSAITGAHPIEIARFYADKAWIGRGVGPALMQACLELARQKGCDTVWLDVWERNPRAIAFYRKWGFEVVGEQTFQLGSDLQHDLLMQCNIG